MARADAYGGTSFVLAPTRWLLTLHLYRGLPLRAAPQRLHGHRDGGPASNECGPTNGDNEVWNLAPDPAHYDAIVAVMRIRENLREYVANINAVTAATGMPMVRIRRPYLSWVGG